MASWVVPLSIMPREARRMKFQDREMARGQSGCNLSNSMPRSIDDSFLSFSLFGCAELACILTSLLPVAFCRPLCPYRLSSFALIQNQMKFEQIETESRRQLFPVMAKQKDVAFRFSLSLSLSLLQMTAAVRRQLSVPDPQLCFVSSFCSKGSPPAPPPLVSTCTLTSPSV